MSEYRHQLDELLNEREVYELYGKLLADKELREARQNGIISWYDLRKGPHYTRDQVLQYLKLKERSACQNQPLNLARAESGKQRESSNLVTIGSPRNQTATGPIAGMNPKLEKLAADQLDAEY